MDRWNNKIINFTPENHTNEDTVPTISAGFCQNSNPIADNKFGLTEPKNS